MTGTSDNETRLDLTSLTWFRQFEPKHLSPRCAMPQVLDSDRLRIKLGYLVYEHFELV